MLLTLLPLKLRRSIHRPIAWLAIASLGSVAVLPIQAIAQTEGSSDPLETFQSPDRDPDAIEGTGGLRPMDLIRQIILKPGQSPAEFQEQQGERLNDEASEFRRRQQQQIETQPNSPTPASSDSSSDL